MHNKRHHVDAENQAYQRYYATPPLLEAIFETNFNLMDLILTKQYFLNLAGNIALCLLLVKYPLFLFSFLF